MWMFCVANVPTETINYEHIIHVYKYVYINTHIHTHTVQTNNIIRLVLTCIVQDLRNVIQQPDSILSHSSDSIGISVPQIL